jgi:hypothetical protein
MKWNIIVMNNIRWKWINGTEVVDTNRIGWNGIGWNGIGRNRRQDKLEVDEMVKIMCIFARLVTNTTGTQEIKPFSHS